MCCKVFIRYANGNGLEDLFNFYFSNLLNSMSQDKIAEKICDIYRLSIDYAWEVPRFIYRNSSGHDCSLSFLVLKSF